MATTLHELVHDSPTQVLQTLQDMHHELEGSAASSETLDRVRAAINYLDKRSAQMDAERAHLHAAGYPLGSGSVERGNKIVVGARLEGARMHWALTHVNPMVALRDVLWSDRWEEDWLSLATRACDQSVHERQQRQRARWTQRCATATIRSNAIPVSVAPIQSPDPESIQIIPMIRNGTLPKKPSQPYRPSANHPWRHSPIGRARFKSSQRSAVPIL